MQFLHHVDVVQALGAGLAPAHILETAGHILLAVEVVGQVSGAAQRLFGVVHHGGNLLLRGEPPAVVV